MRYHEMPMQTVYAKTLGELIEEDSNVLCLEADLAKASGTIPEISEKYPDHFIDVGVSEANMISLGAGLAVRGENPLLSSFTCFATRRVYDQITISVCYPNNNVKIVGTAPGITQGSNGGTHMCFLDLAIMRAMPNMHVYSAADAYELRAIMRYMAKTKQPTYLQVIRFKMPGDLRQRLRLRSERGQGDARGRGRHARHDRLHAAVRAESRRQAGQGRDQGRRAALSVGEALR